MTQMTGMDVQQVRQLAQQMSNGAQQIRALQQQLSSQLEATPWEGADKQRFVGEWTGTHVRNLIAVATSLETASTDANRNAEQQDAASS